MFKLPVQPRAIGNTLFNVRVGGLFNSPIWVILSTVDYDNLSHSITCRAEFPDSSQVSGGSGRDSGHYSDETQRT